MTQKQNTVKISHIITSESRKKVARFLLAAIFMMAISIVLCYFRKIELAWFASTAANALLVWAFIQLTHIATTELKPKVQRNK